jgi:hypothetical protein
MKGMKRKPCRRYCLINFCLAEYLHDFNKDNDDSFPEETLGLLKFKDRESAKRTLEWVKSRVQKEHTGKFPIFEKLHRRTAGRPLSN